MGVRMSNLRKKPGAGPPGVLERLFQRAASKAAGRAAGEDSRGSSGGRLPVAAGPGRGGDGGRAASEGAAAGEEGGGSGIVYDSGLSGAEEEEEEEDADDRGRQEAGEEGGEVELYGPSVAGRHSADIACRAQQAAPGGEGAPASAARKQPRGAGVLAPSLKTTWVCQACTFADNDAWSLRCNVCETPKGGPLHSELEQRQRSEAALLERLGRQRQGGPAAGGLLSSGCDVAACAGKRPRDDGVTSGGGESDVEEVAPPRPPPVIAAERRTGLEGEGQGKVWPCPECGQPVAPNEWQPHQDHHLAEALQREEACGTAATGQRGGGLLGRRGGARGGRGRGQQRVPQATTLDRFFQKSG
jgi:rubrerythrin